MFIRFQEVVDAPLYNETIFDHNDKITRLVSLLACGEAFDCFCVECGRDSVFEAAWDIYQARALKNNDEKIQYRTTHANIILRPDHGTSYVNSLQMRCPCSRNPTHEINIYLYIHRLTSGRYHFILKKVGQNPSVADIAYGFLSRFGRVIAHDQLRELKRAIGLASHGIGIGSFVYLRRVLEVLVENHKVKAESDGLEFQDWNNKRFVDRVGALQNYLPDVMVRNKSVYSVLSSGIHELTEKRMFKVFSSAT